MNKQNTLDHNLAPPFNLHEFKGYRLRNNNHAWRLQWCISVLKANVKVVQPPHAIGVTLTDRDFPLDLLARSANDQRSNDYRDTRERQLDAYLEGTEDVLDGAYSPTRQGLDVVSIARRPTHMSFQMDSTREVD